VLLALGLFLAANLLATVLAPGGPRWYKLVEETWFKLLLVAVPVVAAGRGEAARRALWLVIAAGTVAAAYAIFQHFTDTDPLGGRDIKHFNGAPVAFGFTNHHLSFGGQLVVLMALVLCWLRATVLADWRRFWLPALVTLVMGLALVWSYARSAQLGVFAVALLLAVTLPAGRWRWAGFAGLAAVLVLAVATPSVRDRVSEGFTDEKEVTRPNLWRSSVAGIADRPLVGWGPGGFGDMLAAHEVPGYYESRAHSHNDFLMHAVNAGLLGLGAALWLILATVRCFWSGWRRGGPGSWLLLGGVAVQTGMVVAGMFQVFQTDDEVEILLYLVLGCCLALAGAAGRADGRVTTQPSTTTSSNAAQQNHD
jgi:putative inorganic carbon (HCO3(-)) transporter